MATSVISCFTELRLDWLIFMDLYGVILCLSDDSGQREVLLNEREAYGKAFARTVHRRSGSILYLQVPLCQAS